MSKSHHIRKIRRLALTLTAAAAVAAPTAVAKPTDGPYPPAADHSPSASQQPSGFTPVPAPDHSVPSPPVESGSTPEPTRVVIRAAGESFDWTAAAVGAAGALGLVMLTLGGLSRGPNPRLRFTH